jgi:hypothetical protein
MSFRIERLVGGEHLVVFRVGGRIHAEQVEMLRDLVGLESGKVAIDLSEVTLVNREAVRLLAFSETNGVELRNCFTYIREWVARERTAIRAELSDLKGGAMDDPEDL